MALNRTTSVGYLTNLAGRLLVYFDDLHDEVRTRPILGKPPEYATQVRKEWNEKRYHTPLDVVMPDWDLSGTREDLAVLFAVGQRVAQTDKFPDWKAGNEFKAKRDAMLKK